MWSQTFSTGLKAFSADWKTIAQCCQRKRRSSSGLSLSASTTRPSRWNRIWPLEMRAAPGSSRISASASVVLPEPLSPIRARLSPRRRSKLTWRTALTAPRRVAYSTDRSRTDRTTADGRDSSARVAERVALLPRPALTPPPQSGIEDLFQRAGHGYERELHDREREDRAEDVEQTVAEEDRTAHPGQLDHHRPVVAGQRHKAEEDQPDL